MKHECKYLVFSCIDFRVQKSLLQYLKKNGYEGDFDFLTAGGEAKNIADTAPEIRDFILGQIAISKELHNTKEIIFVTHEDCGAYGGAKSFKSRNDEFAKHLFNIGKAKQIILEEFPEYTFKILFAIIDGDDFRIVEELPA